MKPILTPLHLSFFFTLFLFITLSHSQPYTPVENIALACGSSGLLTSNDHRTWAGDVNTKFTETSNNSSSTSLSSPPSSTATLPPYTNARLSFAPFTYTIPLSPGKKFIRLHFNPTTYNSTFQLSNSLFSVSADHFTLLHDFNALAFPNPPLVKEYCFNVENGKQKLNLTFTPSNLKAYAFVNGIEVVSMPDDLYYTNSPKFVDTSTPSVYPIGNDTALEMVYRINVGGRPIAPDEDTGMYRNWDNGDEDYLDEASERNSVLPQNNTIELKFVTIPEYVAPKEVYMTGRSMGMNKTINKSYNLTWIFPLDPNFYYLVRLHFCEFESDIVKYGDRSFQIFMANQTAEELADVIGWSKANGNPIYRDYVVDGMFMTPVGNQKTVNLFLVLAALQGDSETMYNDAMLNGLEIFKLSDSRNNLAGPNPDPNTPNRSVDAPNRSRKSTSTAVTIAGMACGVFVASVVVYIFFCRRWNVKQSGNSNKMKFTNIPGASHPCRYFSLAEIKVGTKNFSDTLIIGAGGFGNVYKGRIDNGATIVAVKRLKQGSSQGVVEFETEIEMLSQLRHRHLVSLNGYCSDKGEMILVYDYMAQGTLRDHLYQTDNPSLPWEQRLQICIGSARGLQYLHNGANGTIIHRDVKSTNILLDDKFVAKVSDFGLSKVITNMSKTHISTLVKGSFGYLDPEYYKRQRLTEKSDVYSFGVVLCEVLCARPAVMHRECEEEYHVNLAEWAKRCHQNRELDQIIDPSLRGKIVAECFNVYANIAISCLHDDGTARPSMNDVIRDLELASKLQQSAEEANIICTEKMRETEISSGEQSCAINNSVTCISSTIFSETSNPTGR